MRTLGQKRAKFALDEVFKIEGTLKNEFAKFTAGAPSMILQNGYGQSLAFWLSKATDKDLNIKLKDKWRVSQHRRQLMYHNIIDR